MVGGGRAVGSGKGGHPLPTTHSQHGPMRVGTIRQSESGKEGAGHRPNCFESGRMQWTSCQTQFSTSTLYVQTLKYTVSAVSGHEAGICRHATSTDPAPTQRTAPAGQEPARPSNPVRWAGPGASPWRFIYAMTGILVVITSVANAMGLAD